jgi:chromosome segregation ATPase
MKPPKDHKDQYAVVSPATKSGKYLVCSRRIGPTERLAPIAECRSESVAAHIVEGLHLRQKELVKLVSPLEHRVEELSQALASERSKYAAAKTETGRLKEDVRSLGRRVDDLTHERNRAQQELSVAKLDITTLTGKISKMETA